MTNVYFETNATTTGLFGSTADYYPITNNTGETFDVFVSYQDTNFYGEPIPAFASSVTGVLFQDDANYYLIVTRYSDIVTNQSSAPQIQVFNGANAITNGQTAPVNFGSVPQNQTGPSQTFTVTNAGNAALNLGISSVPSGYSVTQNPPGTLAAGAQGAFMVQLNSAQTGTHSGNIIITNNDPNNGSFSFAVTGTVTSPVTITDLKGFILGSVFYLKWTAVPNIATYGVLHSTNVSGPYTNVARGLTFTTTNGLYPASIRTNAANFYEVSSP